MATKRQQKTQCKIKWKLIKRILACLKWLRNCFSRAVLLQHMLLLCSRHIPMLGSPQMFRRYRRAQPCGTLVLKCPAASLASFLPLWSHPIYTEFASGWVVSRGVRGQAAAGLAEGLQSQAGWDPPKTDQFWGCRTSLCMPGTCLMLMVLDLNLFSRFCLS